MTDDEIISQYGAYTDEQLIHYIKGGIPDWQQQVFQRLLTLRRKSHYENIIGCNKIPKNQESIPVASKPDHDKHSGKKAFLRYVITVTLRYFIVGR